VAWLTGWLYRRAITITEHSGSTLTDYQIRIDLNSSNFDFSKANPDGSDIRFTDSDGTTLLSYWIEKWDSVNEEAVVWVKVPSIPANGSATIYMYYGNSSATDESDGDSTFPFFDDFEDGVIDSNKWSITADQEGAVVEENGTLIVYGSSTPDGVRAVATSTTVNLDYRAKVHVRVMQKNLKTVGNRWYDWFTGTRMTYVGVGTINVGYQWHNYPNWVVLWGANPNDTNTWNPIPSLLDAYHDVEIYAKNGNKPSCKVDGTEYSIENTYDLSGTTGISVQFKGESETNTDGAKSDIYVDYVFIRKFTEPEPSFSIGAEEFGGVISGYVKLPDGTPVSGATVIAIREDTYEVVDITTSGSDGSYALTVDPATTYTVIVIPSDSSQNGDIKCHITPYLAG